MNLTIFGGTGTAGLLTIKEAISKGYKVTAYARNPEKITFKDKNLHVVVGELTEYEKIEKVIRGSDAVISLLGPKAKAKETKIANGYDNIIKAMVSSGKKRLITAVSSSYSDEQDRFNFMVRFGILLLKIMGASILKDIIKTGDLIRNSPLDWTMARLPMLKNSPGKGNLYAGYVGDGKFNFFELTREDLAEFLVEQIEDRRFIKKAPAISNL